MTQEKKLWILRLNSLDFYFKGKLNANPNHHLFLVLLHAELFVLLFFCETNGSLKWTQEAIEEVDFMHTSILDGICLLTTDYLNIGIQHICPLLQKLKYFTQSLLCNNLRFFKNKYFLTCIRDNHNFCQISLTTFKLLSFISSWPLPRAFFQFLLNLVPQIAQPKP